MKTIKKVDTIPQLPKIKFQSKVQRVAVYARVSTNHEDQKSSIEAQKDYYEKLVHSHSDWILVGIYADEGISRTSFKRRDAFKQMMTDCEGGKIDRVITKSVSRFARNTVDVLKAIRKLKVLEIGIYFEKENIWTLDSKGEFLITIMTSFAQEESRSISENVKWGHRKRFADGKVTIPYKAFLGYKKGKDGQPEIVEEEAKSVRLIYKLYLDGLTVYSIGLELERRGIKKTKWSKKTVESILTNEKYKGDALLQKTFIVDFLTKKSKVNEGEVSQYYVENSHPAIIDPEVFDMVQEEIERREKNYTRYSGVSSFSSKIQCGECCGWYGSKVWHSNDVYRRIIYQCNNKFRNKTGCKTPHLTEAEIKRLFLTAMNQLITEKKEILSNLRHMGRIVSDKEELLKRKETLEEELSIIVEKTQNLINDNARIKQKQNYYNEKYNALVNKYVLMKNEYDEVCTNIYEKDTKKGKLERFIKVLKGREELIQEFDETLWSALLDRIVVYSKDEIVVIFKDGTEVKVE